jgi:predicted transcriptional regulator of viral defense system
MKFESLVEVVGGLPCFDMPLLVQAFTVKRPVLRVQLSRWMQSGKVIGLRRGVYLLAPAYRRMPVNTAVLANQLYSPSYLSGLWAMGYYDIIPEHVVWLTSVTSRVPRHFENPVGVFDYRNVKQSFFFGYGTKKISNQEVRVADPEKALLDYWHLTSGEWTTTRLKEMRFQHVDLISGERLKDYGLRFKSLRLNRTIERWLKLVVQESEGWVTV